MKSARFNPGVIFCLIVLATITHSQGQPGRYEYGRRNRDQEDSEYHVSRGDSENRENSEGNSRNYNNEEDSSPDSENGRRDNRNDDSQSDSDSQDEASENVARNNRNERGRNGNSQGSENVARIRGNQDCEYDQDGFIFYRMLILKKEGGFATVDIGRERMSRYLGNCVNLPNQMFTMRQFFTSFGFELGRDFERDVYSQYGGREVNITTFGSSDFRLVMSSLFDFTKFSNRQVYEVGWFLTTNRDLRLRDRRIPGGSSLVFGAYRMHVHGRDFCIQYHSNNFLPPFNFEDPRPIPVDLNLVSREWGNGTARGIVVNMDREQNIWDQRLVLTFPANEVSTDRRGDGK